MNDNKIKNIFFIRLMNSFCLRVNNYKWDVLPPPNRIQYQSESLGLKDRLTEEDLRSFLKKAAMLLPSSQKILKAPGSIKKIDTQPIRRRKFGILISQIQNNQKRLLKITNMNQLWVVPKNLRFQDQKATDNYMLTVEYVLKWDFPLTILQMGDFCYWQAKSQQDCIIIYINMAITILLAIIIIVFYCRASVNFRRRVALIYSVLILWTITNLVKDVYSIVVYHTDIKDGQLLARHSQIFAILDTPPAIIVQTLFLAIPYKMLKNVINLLVRMDLERTMGQQQLLNFLVFYLIVRAVILFFPWLALFLVSSNHAGSVNLTKLLLQLVDSLICNLLLLVSLRCFLKRFGQIQMDSESDKDKIRCEYWLMVMFSTFRFLIDLVYLIVLPTLYNSDCIGPISQHLYFSIGYTLAGTWLMHLVPIALIVYIYKPQK